MLLDFEGAVGFALAGNVELDGEGIVNGGQFPWELDIHHRTDDLDNFAFIHVMLQFNSAERARTLRAVARGVKTVLWAEISLPPARGGAKVSPGECNERERFIVIHLGP
jgi:hypothetical protein